MYHSIFLIWRIFMSKIIICPHCGMQYLPGEIFYPEEFLGKPKDIVRNTVGEILGYEGIEQNSNETFVCEECKNEFTVEAKISYVVSTGETNTPVEIAKLSLF